jgi:hydroxyacylglutathione hydrolase
MRLKPLCSAMILVAVAVLAACNGIDQSARTQKPTTLGPETTYADGARRVTIDELDQMMKDGTAVIIDVRNQSAYDLGHIPGSKLIPSTEILNRTNELPRDKMIITYCS